MIFLKEKPIIGEGFKHVAYHDGEYVYKTVKDDFITLDTHTDYEIEIAALKLIGEHGLPVPDTMQLLMAF